MPGPARIRRTSDVVRRPLGFWSPAVHQLLGYLQDAGFPAPRVVGTEDHDELLSWIDGESGPLGWSRIVPEAGLRRWASFLRQYHDTVAGYQPPLGSIWSAPPVRDRPAGAGEIVCHGDFGPWNGVWRGKQIVGLIDFDRAWPASPLSDVAYALEYAAPFRDDQECVRWLRYPEPPDRRRRIEVFCAAYGTAVPADVATRVAAQQRLVLSQCAALGGRGIEPQATWVRDGYLGTVRARIRGTEA